MTVISSIHCVPTSFKKETQSQKKKGKRGISEKGTNMWFHRLHLTTSDDLIYWHTAPYLLLIPVIAIQKRSSLHKEEAGTSLIGSPHI